MTVARREGESIFGEKITYAFGKVNVGRRGDSFVVSYGLNGEAYVVRKWRRRGTSLDAQTLTDSGAVFDSLEAGSARGKADRVREDKRKQHISGAHRGFTGVLIGGAGVTVKIPKGPVRTAGV